MPLFTFRSVPRMLTFLSYGQNASSPANRVHRNGWCPWWVETILRTSLRHHMWIPSRRKSPWSLRIWHSRISSPYGKPSSTNLSRKHERNSRNTLKSQHYAAAGRRSRTQSRMQVSPPSPRTQERERRASRQFWKWAEESSERKKRKRWGRKPIKERCWREWSRCIHRSTQQFFTSLLRYPFIRLAMIRAWS